MFTFKEPLENPIDQLVWAHALLAFLSEVKSRDGECHKLSKDAEIGQSAIIETACDIINDVISGLNEKQIKDYTCFIVVIEKQKE